MTSWLILAGIAAAFAGTVAVKVALEAADGRRHQVPDDRQILYLVMTLAHARRR